MDILSEIKKLPNLGYRYYKDNGTPCLVVLGGESCPPSDDYRFGESIIHHHCEISRLYEMKPFSDDIKDAIVYRMKKMRSACDTRKYGTHTPTQQAAYIDALSPDEHQQIEEQVLMYKECHEIYLESIRKSQGRINI